MLVDRHRSLGCVAGASLEFGAVLMRTGERSREVFDSLVERGEIVLHASDVERTATLAAIGAAGDQLVIADTREQVSALNDAIRDQRTGSGERSGEPVTKRGERIGLGDSVATRRNDRDLGVANRDTWTVAGIGADGSLLVVGSRWSARAASCLCRRARRARLRHHRLRRPGRHRRLRSPGRRRGDRRGRGVRRDDPRPPYQRRSPRR